MFTGRTVSTVEEEQKFNPRLTKTENEFVDIMEHLGLPYPDKIGKESKLLNEICCKQNHNE